MKLRILIYFVLSIIVFENFVYWEKKTITVNDLPTTLDTMPKDKAKAFLYHYCNHCPFDTAPFGCGHYHPYLMYIREFENE